MCKDTCAAQYGRKQGRDYDPDTDRRRRLRDGMQHDQKILIGGLFTRWISRARLTWRESIPI